MNMFDDQGPKEFGWLTKILIKIASADEATLRISPADDLRHVKETAWLLILVMVYQAALFSMVSHRLFAAPSQIRPELVLISTFLAFFIMKIDSYTVVASQWYLSGIESIRGGGVDISGGKAARIKAGIFLAFRILLTLSLAQLTAIFVSLIIFGADIDARIHSNYLQANAHLVADATALVDSEIRLVADQLKAATASVATASAQATAVRQSQIDPSANDPQVQQAQTELNTLIAQRAKALDEVSAAEALSAAELGGIKSAATSGVAGNGPKRKAALEQVANAKAHAEAAGKELDAARTRLDDLRKQLATANEATKQQSHDQLPAFEAALAEETSKMSALKDQLASLTQGRNDAIRRAVENAPNHVKYDDGFLAQLRELKNLGEADNKIAAIILLIDAASFGFELAAVLGKITACCPTTYSGLIARDAFLRSVHIADEISRELELCARKFTNEADSLQPPPPANDNQTDPTLQTGSDATPSDPPPQSPKKRGRGRPRKSRPE